MVLFSADDERRRECRRTHRGSAHEGQILFRRIPQKRYMRSVDDFGFYHEVHGPILTERSCVESWRRPAHSVPDL